MDFARIIENYNVDEYNNLPYNLVKKSCKIHKNELVVAYGGYIITVTFAAMIFNLIWFIPLLVVTYKLENDILGLIILSLFVSCIIFIMLGLQLVA